MVGKPFNCLKSSLAVLIDLLLQTKSKILPTVESIATQIQHLDFLPTKLQSSSTSMKEQAFVLGWLTGNCSSLNKRAGDSFVMHPEDSANGSESQSFKG